MSHKQALTLNIIVRWFSHIAGAEDSGQHGLIIMTSLANAILALELNRYIFRCRKTAGYALQSEPFF